MIADSNLSSFLSKVFLRLIVRDTISAFDGFYYFVKQIKELENFLIKKSNFL